MITVRFCKYKDSRLSTDWRRWKSYIPLGHCDRDTGEIEIYIDKCYRAVTIYKEDTKREFGKKCLNAEYLIMFMIFHELGHIVMYEIREPMVNKFANLVMDKLDI